MRGIEPFGVIANPFIVGESERFVAVFKPAGMHSAPHGGAIPLPTDAVSMAGPSSVLAWLLAQRPDHAAAFAVPGLGPRAARECGMLSRLDKETSGLILFARSPEAFVEALASQESGRLRKAYRLVAASAQDETGLPGSRPPRWPDAGVTGLFSPKKSPGGAPITIKSYFRPYGKGRASVACLAASAVEVFKKERSPVFYATVIQGLASSLPHALMDRKGLFVLEAWIASGFRHQIRAHLAWAGCPILGDERYGGLAAPRLFLEAHRVEILSEAGESFELYGEQAEVAFPTDHAFSRSPRE